MDDQAQGIRSIQNVGVIGIGRIGNPVAANLLKAGYTVHVHDIREDAYIDLVEQGAVVQSTPQAVGQASEIVLICLMTIDLVEKVLFGQDGVACSDLAGKIVIDMSTGIPSQTQRMATRVAALGGAMLDAPVTGGEGGAHQGTLNIMVGGDRDAFARCRDLLDVLGQTVIRVGPSGAGQVAKHSNQMIMSGYFAAIIEALAFVERCDVDVDKVLQVIEHGGAQSRQLSNIARAYEQSALGDNDPDHSDDHYALLFAKDVHYILQEGYRRGIPLPLTATILELFKQGLFDECEGQFPLRLIQLWHRKK